ncbi:hypothetical protein HDU76_003048 [Blyttiomyces sp. JEL0837]|nr:hypothetical protein HDU76_003048 [Blyttiomyces sp. JEL0837]
MAARLEDKTSSHQYNNDEPNNNPILHNSPTTSNSQSLASDSSNNTEVLLLPEEKDNEPTPVQVPFLQPDTAVAFESCSNDVELDGEQDDDDNNDGRVSQDEGEGEFELRESGKGKRRSGVKTRRKEEVSEVEQEALEYVESQIDLKVVLNHLSRDFNDTRQNQFLKTVMAVSNIVNKKLYRTEFSSLETYFKTKWNEFGWLYFQTIIRFQEPKSIDFLTALMY